MGVIALVVLVAIPAAIAWCAETILALVPLGIVGSALLGSSLLAQRSLATHVKAVADALDEGGVVAGRKAVSQIVGRDPERLDEAGVSRAAIESLAENFSDGIVAPAFWLAVGGLAGGAAYKAVNTAEFDDRPQDAAPRSFRLGGGALRRPDQPACLAADRASAGAGGVCCARR